VGKRPLLRVILDQISWLFKASKLVPSEALKDKIIRLPNNIRIPQKTIDIHGITNERMLEEGEPIDTVLDSFMRDVSSCTYLIGHNIAFDKTMVEVECVRNKHKRLSDYRKISFCTMMRGRNECRIEKKNPFTKKTEYKYPKLIELHKHLFATTPENSTHSPKPRNNSNNYS
jgi:DNA polymerase III epsilon subunit-like protein